MREKWSRAKDNKRLRTAEKGINEEKKEEQCQSERRPRIFIETEFALWAPQAPREQAMDERRALTLFTHSNLTSPPLLLHDSPARQPAAAARLVVVLAL